MLEELVYEHIKRVNAHKEKILDEGRAEGYHHALLFMLKERFGEIPENWRKKILSISVSHSFDQVASAILTAKAADDFGNKLDEIADNQ